MPIGLMSCRKALQDDFHNTCLLCKKVLTQDSYNFRTNFVTKHLKALENLGFEEPFGRDFYIINKT